MAASDSNIKIQRIELDGESAHRLESERLCLDILERGARLVSVRDKKYDSEFIGHVPGNSGEPRGIYDRCDTTGNLRFGSRYHDSLLVNQAYHLEQDGDGAVTFRYVNEHIDLRRRFILVPDEPGVRVEVELEILNTPIGEPGIWLMSQLNPGNSAYSFDHTLLYPDDNCIERENLKLERTDIKDTRKGCWAMCDRDSGKAIHVTYCNDRDLEKLFAYRVPEWLHLVPMLSKCVVSQSFWQEYHFLNNVDETHKLKSGFSSLLEKLAEEQKLPSLRISQRKFKLDQAINKAQELSSPLGQPLASVGVCCTPIFDHPHKLDARSWLSIPKAKNLLSEMSQLDMQSFVMLGMSANGCEEELAVNREILAQTHLPARFVACREDLESPKLKERFFSPLNWVECHDDLVLIGMAENHEDWLEEQLREHSDKRIIVIAARVDPDTMSRHSITMAIFKTKHEFTSFSRKGLWTILHLPDGSAFSDNAYLLLQLHERHLVVHIKEPNQDFSPFMVLDKTGRCPPPENWINEDPKIRVAHISDTQLALPSRLKTPEGKALDQENLKQAISELNDHEVDLVVNTGDLVNRGEREDEWALYKKLNQELIHPLHAVLGNHDTGQQETKDEVNTEAYTRHVSSTDPKIIEKNGVMLLLFSTLDCDPKQLRALLPQTRRAKQIIMAYHDPINHGEDDYSWWSAELYEIAKEFGATLHLCGHTHKLAWRQYESIREIVAPALAWTFHSDQSWNGYFIHHVFEKTVVSCFHRLRCPEVFWSATSKLPISF